VGSFVQSALRGEHIEVFGVDRRRSIVYAPDIADVVCEIMEIRPDAFRCLNVSGTEITIEALANLVVGIAGRGKVINREIPEKVKTIDVGNAVLSETGLRSLIAAIPSTDLTEALRATINYFRESEQ
jgi:nucleoside-diphosphate-sugar epimerase